MHSIAIPADRTAGGGHRAPRARPAPAAGWRRADRSAARSAERHGQLHHRTGRDRLAPVDSIGGELVVAEPGEQGVNAHASFEAPEVDADAVVDPEPEREV